MKELIRNIFETSNERIKNPFIGAFILAWIACNWRPVSLFLMSNYSIEARINIIEEEYSGLFLNLYLPITIALVYVVAIPYLMWLIDVILQKSTSGRKRNLLIQQIEDYQGKQKLAIEESKLEDIKANYREKADLNHQIEKLREQVDQRDEIIAGHVQEIKDLSEINSKLEKSVTDGESSQTDKEQLNEYRELYYAFEDSDLFKHFFDIGKAIRNENKFPLFTNDLIREKYLFQEIVEEVRTKNGAAYYRFTKKGFFFWKTYILNANLENQEDKSKLLTDEEVEKYF